MRRSTCNGERYNACRIRILVTGGTFDKKYDELTGRLFFRDTHVPEMLRLGRCRLDVAIETVMMIDSLELDDEGARRDRGRAPRARENARSWSRTAPTRWCRRRARWRAAALDGKTIVLTGAMVPYAFGSSDGLFNLGQRAVVRAGAAARRLRCDERAAFPLGRRAQEHGHRLLRDRLNAS